MAKFKLGAIVTEIRGKIGGTVFSRNKGGAYMKNKTTPSNPRTSAQQDQRAKLTFLAQLWRALNGDQRQSWIEASPNFPMVDVFGDTYTLSGNMLHNRLNLNLDKVGASQITEAPLPEGTQKVQLDSAAASALAVELTLSDVMDGDNLGLVSATPPFSPGINNYSKRLRNLVVVNTASTAAVTITADYIARFGEPKAGQKIGFEFTPINKNTGESGVPTKLAVIVS